MNHPSRGEMFDELSNWNVGAGIVTMALFPLALPGIILAAALALPLLALALPLLLIGGIGVGAFRVGRGLGRLIGRLVGGLRRREQTPAEAVPAPPAPKHA